MSKNKATILVGGGFMRFVLFIFILTFSLSACAEHALGAHEHGAVKLGMAIEQKNVDLDLDAPAESFLGFEYLPQSANEKKMFEQLKMNWEKNIFSLLAFDTKLDCKVVSALLLQKVDGAHSDIEATARISCARNIEGSDLHIFLIEKYNHIKKIQLEVLGSISKSIQLKKRIEVVKI